MFFSIFLPKIKSNCANLTSRIKGIRIKSCKSFKICSQSFSLTLKEGARREDLEHFLENLFLGMHSRNYKCRFGLKGATIVQLDYTDRIGQKVCPWPFSSRVKQSPPSSYTPVSGNAQLGPPTISWV